MVASVGSATVPSCAPTGAGSCIQGSGTGLQAELARVKKEYSASINCESASSETGKQHIQQLDIRIKQLEARIVNAPTQIVSNTAPASSTGGRIDLFA